MSKRLAEVVLCSIVITLLHSKCSKVVVCTIVVWIDVNSLLQHCLTLCVVVCQKLGSIKQFLHRKQRRFRLINIHNLLVATTNHIIVDGHTSTTQFRKHSSSKFGINRSHIANFTLALFWVLIHGKHTKDEVLVLQVRLAHKFLESFPVLSRVFHIHVRVELCLLQLLLHVGLRHISTTLSQTLIEVVATIW